MVIKSRVCLKPKVSTNGDDVRWIQETYLLPANNIEAGIKKKKKHFSLDFSLILCSAEVVLGTFKRRLVMLTKVAVPSTRVPAGQERAITALWLQYGSSRQPPGDGPIEIPLQAPSWQRRSPPPRCLTGPLTQTSDIKRQAKPQMRCVMWLFGPLICVGGWRIYSCRPSQRDGTEDHRDAATQRWSLILLFLPQ